MCSKTLECFDSHQRGWISISLAVAVSPISSPAASHGLWTLANPSREGDHTRCQPRPQHNRPGRARSPQHITNAFRDTRRRPPRKWQILGGRNARDEALAHRPCRAMGDGCNQAHDQIRRAKQTAQADRISRWPQGICGHGGLLASPSIVGAPHGPG